MSEAHEPRPTPLGLFEGFGVELEYMIVDRESFNVRPLADRLLEAAAGEQTGDVERGSATACCVRSAARTSPKSKWAP